MGRPAASLLRHRLGDEVLEWRLWRIRFAPKSIGLGADGDPILHGNTRRASVLIDPEATNESQQHRLGEALHRAWQILGICEFDPKEAVVGVSPQLDADLLDLFNVGPTPIHEEAAGKRQVANQLRLKKLYRLDLRRPDRFRIISAAITFCVRPE